MDILSTVHSFFEQYWLSIPWQMILSEILSKLISLAILSILFIVGKKVLHKIFKKQYFPLSNYPHKVLLESRP